MTYVRSEVEAACPPDDAPRRLAMHLGAPLLGGGEATYRLELPFQEVGLPQVGIFTLAVRLILGRAQEHRVYGMVAETRVPIAWRVPENRVLPTFAGHLDLMPLCEQRTQLTMTGCYRSPGGVAGAAFGAMLGSRVAEAITRRFIGRVKDALECAPAFRRAAQPTRIR